MAIDASLDYVDGLVGLFLLTDNDRDKVGDDPHIDDYDPGDRLWFYWDAQKLYGRGEYDFLGLEINDISLLREEDLAAIDRLDLPRVNVPEMGIVNNSVGDVLRWAQKVFPSRYSTASV